MAKIVFITTLSHVSWGGSEQLWHKTALFAKEQGHDVLCIVYKISKGHSKIKKLLDNNIKVLYRLSYYNSKNFIDKVLSYLNRKFSIENIIFKKLIKFQPDYICISQGGTFDLGYNNQNNLTKALIKLNKPYIIICQNNSDVGFVPEKEVRDKVRFFFRNAKKVIFSSKRNHLVAQRQLTINFSNIYFTSNPLTIREVSIKPYPNTDIFYFAVVAALKISHKGQDILLEVLSSDKWKDRNWKLNIYGSGEDEVYLKELTKFLNLEEKVSFRGFVEDMDKLWLENHIYLLPSLGEGLPITLCDAMLSGRTAVVTDVGGNSELIIDNETGFLCPAPTVKLFDETLERAWQNRHKWQQMGVAAYNYAKSKINLNPHITLLDIITK